MYCVRPFLRLIAPVLLLATTACDSPTDNSPGPPAQLEVVTGNAQTGEVGAELSQPLTIRVTDARGRPVPNVSVTWSVTAGRGSLFVPTSTTDEEGIATNRWTLGTGAGVEQRVEARVASSTGAALVTSFQASARARGVAQVVQEVSPRSGRVAQKLSEPFGVRILDQYGNPVPNVTVTFEIKSGRGTVEPKTVVTGDAGAARTLWTLGTLAGTDTLFARVEGYATPVAFPVTVAPGEPVNLEIRPASLNLLFGDTVHVRAIVRDRYGNEVPNVPVSWRSLSRGVAFATELVPGGASAFVHAIGVGSVTLVATAAEKTAQTAVTVQPLRFTSVSVGMTVRVNLEPGNHACALIPDGRAFCWGSGAYGELGYEARAAPDPLSVTSRRSYRQISAGGGFTCAITADDSVYCWGDNSSGQLGAASEETCLNRRFPCSDIPLLAAGGMKFRSISAGFSHICGIATSGTAYCWGDNSSGQLGNGSTADSQQAVPVQTSRTFSEITAGGFHTCARETNTGNLYCWGSNSGGELGNGTTTNSSVPVPVSGGQGFTSVRAAESYTCAQTTQAIYCWGTGYGTTPRFDQNRTFAQWSVGRDHRCGIDQAGTAYCWGTNAFGQLGTGNTTSSPTPVPVAGGLTFRSIDVGGNSSCGVTTENRAYCWGQAMTLNTSMSSSPRLVPGQQ